MNLLFLCVANAARSQMAEGLAKKILGEKHGIQSAGSSPWKLHPFAAKVMTEVGIDISDQFSKSVKDIDCTKVDVIITLCNDEVCPVLSGCAKKYHWPLQDPATPMESEEAQIELFRRIRDEIKEKITNFKKVIGH